MGAATWELFAAEHGVPWPPRAAPVLPGDRSTLWRETAGGLYSPRAVLVDTESAVAGPLRNHFGTDAVVCGVEDAANNYARGRYTAGRALLPDLEDAVLRQLEASDAPQALLLTASAGGGTGSGLTGGLLATTLWEECRKKVRLGLVVTPSARTSTAVVEPYNAVLGAQAAQEGLALTLQLANDALWRVCARDLRLPRPDYADLNCVAAQVWAALSASARFPGELNTDLNEFQTNLVPWPRLHYPLVAAAPWAPAPADPRAAWPSVAELTAALLQGSAVADALLGEADLRTGALMAAMLLYRGALSASDAVAALARLRQGGTAVGSRRTTAFAGWSAAGTKLGLTAAPMVVPAGSALAAAPVSVLGLLAHSAVVDGWTRLGNKFDVMFRKRAFVHWFVGEGMEEEEFRTARADLGTLVADYRAAVVA